MIALHALAVVGALHIADVAIRSLCRLAAERSNRREIAEYRRQRAEYEAAVTKGTVHDLGSNVDILNHLPNGGAVVAVIAVVILFLKQHETQQKRYDDRMDVIMSKFMAELTDSRRVYIERLDRIERSQERPGHATRTDAP